MWHQRLWEDDSLPLGAPLLDAQVVFEDILVIAKAFVDINEFVRRSICLSGNVVQTLVEREVLLEGDEASNRYHVSTTSLSGSPLSGLCGACPVHGFCYVGWCGRPGS